MSPAASAGPAAHEVPPSVWFLALRCCRRDYAMSEVLNLGATRYDVAIDNHGGGSRNPGCWLEPWGAALGMCFREPRIRACFLGSAGIPSCWKKEEEGGAMVRVHTQPVGGDKDIVEQNELERLVEVARRVEDVQVLEVKDDLPRSRD